MSRAPEAIIQSIVHITEQRQLASLVESLISTIEQTLVGARGFVYEYNAQGKFVDLSKRPAGPALSSILETLLTRAVLDPFCLTLDEQDYAVFPIVLNNRVVKALFVVADVITEQDLNLLRGFSRIYENFFRVFMESETDSLTGLYNRKAFTTKLLCAIEVSQNLGIMPDNALAGPDGKPCFWLCIFDVDHFKQVNDVYGHLYGDEVLLQVANAMKDTFHNDILFRFGGDEFVILLALRSADEMRTICSTFQQRVAAINNGQECRITLSIGVVMVSGIEDPNTLLINADKALYFSKENGRNRVSYYHELLARGDIQLLVIDDDIELF